MKQLDDFLLNLRNYACILNRTYIV